MFLDYFYGCFYFTKLQWTNTKPDWNRFSYFCFWHYFRQYFIKPFNETHSIKQKNFFAELPFLLITIIWFFVLLFGGDNTAPVYILLLAVGVNSGVKFSYLMKISGLCHNRFESKLKIFLYGALGAWLASFIGGGFLILVWGMEKSIIFIAALKFLIFCRWADLTKRGL
jgi:hypothetical protein